MSGQASNDANTFKPYNPGEITGPTSPGLPYIEPPDKGCGTLGMIIMVAIAVVVAVYAGPAATAYFQGAFGATAVAVGTSTVMMGSTAALVGGAVVGGAVAGAAAVAASSAAGSAMGVASFSWRGVAAGAITGALTAGAGAGFGGAGSFGRAAVVALTNAGANYAGQKLAGVDVSFSWKSIAASAIGSVIGGKLAGKVNLGSDFANDFTVGMAGGMVSAGVRKALGGGGRTDYMTIVADAFGNALGNALSRNIRGAGSQVGLQNGVAQVRGSGLDLADPNYRPNWLYGKESLETWTFGDWGSSEDGGSFLDRYPYATASLANGDVRRSNAIDPGMLARGNAALRTANGGENPYPIHTNGGLLWGNGDMTYGLGPDPQITTEALSGDGLVPAYYRAANGALLNTDYYGYPGSASGSPVGAYGLRAARGDATLLWDVFADSANSVGETTWNWFAQTGFGQSAMGQRIMEQRTYVPHWNLDGIKAGIMPVTTELGRRGTSGTFIDDAIGRTKAVYNFGRDLIQLGGIGLSQTQYILTGTRPYELPRATYSDKQLMGASQIEIATFIAPEVAALGRSAKVLSTVERMGVANTSGWTPLAKSAHAYVRDIEVQTGMSISPQQRTMLANDLRVNEYSRLSPEAAASHRAEFGRMKNDLIEEWQVNTGQTWPTYTQDVLSRNGTVVRRIGQPYDAHHVIESSYGGPNQWWNIHPARFPDQHQG